MRGGVRGFGAGTLADGDIHQNGAGLHGSYQRMIDELGCMFTGKQDGTDNETPYVKLKSLHDASDYPKPDITFRQLDVQATKMSANDAAMAMNNARKKLFKDIAESIKKQA